MEKTVAGVSTRALFEWSGPGEDIVRQLLYALKGGGFGRVHRAMAAEFSLAAPLPCDRGRLLFVPAPPRHPGEMDHAWEWGKALCHWWNGVWAPVLERADQEVQRTKSIDQRQQRHLQLSQRGLCWQRLAPGAHDRVIFVDDVITTGATLAAAQAALGHRGPFSAWAVAYRTRLRRTR